MDMLADLQGGFEADETMARSRKPIDVAKVERLAGLLLAHSLDAEKFKSTIFAIESDRSLTATELIEIAFRFVGGRRQHTGKAAKLAIEQERVRISHATAKGANASKTRVW